MWQFWLSKSWFTALNRHHFNKKVGMHKLSRGTERLSGFTQDTSACQRRVQAQKLTSSEDQDVHGEQLHWLA